MILKNKLHFLFTRFSIFLNILFIFNLIAANALAFDEDDIKIHGFISQGYMKSSDYNYLTDSTDGSFQFNEAGINFTSELSDELSVGIQLFRRGLDDRGVIIDWAYGDYRYSNELGLRVGRFKQPYGLYNTVRDYDILRTAILLPQSIYDENLRSFFVAVNGFSFYGTLSSEHAGTLVYEAFGGTTSVNEINRYVEDQFLKTQNPAFPDSTSSSQEYAYGGSLQWEPPVDGLKLGTTFMTGSSDFDFKFFNSPVTSRGKLTEDRIITLSAEYAAGDFTFTAEYSLHEYTISIPDLPAPPYNREQDSFYGQVTYNINDHLAIGTYYSEYYFDKSDRNGTQYTSSGLPDFYAWQKDLALSLMFRVSTNWILKAEAHQMNGVALVSWVDNPQLLSSSDSMDEDWLMYMFKASFFF